MTVIVPKNGTCKVKDDVSGTESATVTLETPGKNNAPSVGRNEGFRYIAPLFGFAERDGQRRIGRRQWHRQDERKLGLPVVST
jgi:hypothetical protein